MKVIVFCQTLNNDDLALSDSLNRLSEFAKFKKIDKVFIISLTGNIISKNNYSNKIEIHIINKKKKFFKLLKVYSILVPILLKNRINFLYVYMGNIFPIILSPLKLLFNFKILIWYGHLTKNIISFISLKFFSDIWLSSDNVYNIYNLNHFKNIGHGVDNNIFYSYINFFKRSDSLVCVGRISKVKNINLIIESLFLLKNINKISIKLIIVGAPYVTDDFKYKKYLEELIKTLGLESNVNFVGHLNLHQINKIYNQNKFYISSCPGGLGKSGIESIHSGCIPIIAEPKLSSFNYDLKMKENLICNRNSFDIYKKIFYLLKNDKTNRSSLKSLEKIKLDFTYNNLTKNIINIYNESLL